MKKIVKRILTVMGVLILLFLIFIGYGVGINNRFYKLLIVTSGSMSPTFQAGDLICIVKIDPAKVKVGDVVTFQTTEGMILTHRVVAIKSDGEVITKGDANNANDLWDNGWKLAKVETKYVFKLPKLGYTVSWCKEIVIKTLAMLSDTVVVNNEIVADVPTPSQ